jgi:hypothetical protein
MKFGQVHSLELPASGNETHVIGAFKDKTIKPPYFPIWLCYFSRTPSIPGSHSFFGQVELLTATPIIPGSYLVFGKVRLIG